MDKYKIFNEYYTQEEELGGQGFNNYAASMNHREHCGDY